MVPFRSVVLVAVPLVLLALLVAPPARAERPSCRTGADGRAVCGYACRLGSDGAVACADTPDGVCALGSDGRVVCTELAFLDDELRAESADRPVCRLGSDGRVACGYGCRLGSDGRAVCARGPDGVCAVGADGRVVCRDSFAVERSLRFGGNSGGQGDRWRRERGHGRGGPAAAVRPECRTGADGRAVCGYHCRMGADGRVVCANSPDDVCAMGADGRVACSDVGRR
jgi:hypothetical protein